MTKMKHTHTHKLKPAVIYVSELADRNFKIAMMTMLKKIKQKSREFHQNRGIYEEELIRKK